MKFILSLIVLILLLGVNISGLPRPAVAESAAARWTKVSIPTEGDAGHWALAADSDIGCLTAGADGMFYAYVAGPTYTLYRSPDSGYSWEHIGEVRGAITDIAVSPQDSRAIYYATASDVFRSTDGGQTFLALPPHPGDAGTGHKEITSIDIVSLDSNIVVAGVRDDDAGEFGGVYILNEADIVPTWADTGIGSHDVVAVAFSPYYRDDGRVVAVATDESDTYIHIWTGYSGWNAEIGYARLDIAAASAEIAFAGALNPEEPVFFVCINTAAGAGDVYRINGRSAPETSIATDLNAGSAYGINDMDTGALAAYENDGNVVLLAGAAASAMTFVSSDGGATWTRSLKAPTGESVTGVLIDPASSATGRMYAVTGGRGSALSLSRDLGLSWNQLSLIDAAIDSIVDLAPSPRYGEDGTIFLLTFGRGPFSGGLWRSQDGGGTWERTLSDSPDNLESLGRVALPPEFGDDCLTVFVAGTSRGSTAIWESTDGGRTYRRRFARNPAGGTMNIDTWAIADKTTILVGSYDGSQGNVYKSTNQGLTFTGGMPCGRQPLHDIALSPRYDEDGTVLVAGGDGRIYIADNQSGAFRMLSGETGPMPFSGAVNIAFDPAFDVNRTVYATGDGVYRFVADGTGVWEDIDVSLPAGAVPNRLTLGGDGTLYVANAAADGGMERSLNPASAGPDFETVTRGLSGGTRLYGLWQAGYRLWSVDTTGTRLVTYVDTLTVPPVPVSPGDGDSAMGDLVAHTVRNITLDWETVDGATGYQWECSYDDDFSAESVAFGGSTSGSSVRLPALEPATTYRWRVRAGGPTLGPWSETRSFTTVMDTEAVTLRPESPAVGATGVPVKPVFQWTAIIGAEAYELLVATSAGMDSPVIAMTGDRAIAGNAWQCDATLEYATTYYWEVRAVSAITSSDWSTTGVFTTEAAPLPPTPPVETPAATINGEVAAITPLVENVTPAPLVPAPAPSVNGTILPSLSETPEVPDWILYLVGGLLATVILALLVVLVVVLKARRIS